MGYEIIITIILTVILCSLCFYESKQTKSSLGKISLLLLGIAIIISGIGLCFYIYLKNNSNKFDRYLHSIRNHKKI